MAVPEGSSKPHAPTSAAGSTGGLLRVTLTDDEVVRLPASSAATPVSTWAPFAVPNVFQLRSNGAWVTGEPRSWPSSLNCTEATPTLSEADAVTLVVPISVEPAVGALSDTAGACVSGGGGPTVVNVELTAAPSATPSADTMPVVRRIVFRVE